MTYEPDEMYRGLRINQAGNYRWQVVYDTQRKERFTVIRSGLESKEDAKRWIDELIAAIKPDNRCTDNSHYFENIDHGCECGFYK